MSRTRLFQTSAAADRVIDEVCGAMTPSEKVHLMDDGWESMRELTPAGLRLRHPTEPERELSCRFVEIVPGPEFAARAHGPISDWT